MHPRGTGSPGGSLAKRIAFVAGFFVSAQAFAQPAPYSGLGSESVAKAETARFAPPALDARVSRRIQAMLDVRGAESGVITSKGDRMFFTSRVTGSPQVWRQDGPMKLAIQLTGGEDKTSIAGIAHDDSLLSIQGVNDPRVPVGEAVQIYKELERRKIPGGLILFPDEGHQISKRPNQVRHTIAFFEKHLLGREAIHRAHDGG